MTEHRPQAACTDINVRRSYAAQLQGLLSVWPYCYHVTAEENLSPICEYRTLWPTRTLLQLANRSQLVRTRRTSDLRVLVGGRSIIIRNQIPLDPQSVDLGDCAALDDYIAWPNSFVFFWPGNSSRPVENGVRMFHRTARLRSAIMRVPTESLLAVNRDPYVTTCNTGAAWSVADKKASRGPHMFRPLECCSAQAVDIHEICFQSAVVLPDNAEYGSSPVGPWYALLQDSAS